MAKKRLDVINGRSQRQCNLSLESQRKSLLSSRFYVMSDSAVAS